MGCAVTVGTVCPECQKAFSAPDDYLGKKVDCPHCGRRSVLRTLKQVEREAKCFEADREKSALLDRVESRQRVGAPYCEEYQTGTQRVRNFHPRMPSKFLRIRALAELLVLGAYLELFLVAVGIGLTIHLWVEGVVPTASLMVVGILVLTLLGTALFLVLKFLGELAVFFADLGDQQNNTVQLLLDLRENTDLHEGESRRD